MRRLLLRIITAIQLTRLTIAFGAISDIWFVILLTQANDDYFGVAQVHSMPLVPALFAGAVVAVGLFAYGASLNDVLDVRHDTTFSPERPIPAGRIRLGQAVVLTVGSLIIAVLAGASMGTWSVCITLFTAAGLLFYSATGKFIPSIGVLTVGLVHAAHMFIPNHELSFTLPVWLVMTHTMAIALSVHVLEDKRPRFDRRAIVATVVGWVFWSTLLLGAGTWSGSGIWPEEASPFGIIYPVVAVLGFIVMAWWKVHRSDGRGAAEKLKRYGAMWQSLYGAAWLMALGLQTQALGIGLFAIAGFAAMTIIKEFTGYSDRPLTYRV
jgi:4-hydroxybenzoate polyprenyltransferase